MATQIPNITIHNVDENQFIERKMNANELAETKKLQEEIAKFDEIKVKQAEAKAQAKADLLDRLGITAFEAKLLLS